MDVKRNVFPEERVKFKMKALLPFVKERQILEAKTDQLVNDLEIYAPLSTAGQIQKLRRERCS